MKKMVHINVNGRKRNWTEKIIKYENVVLLAFEHSVDNPNIIFTITYSGKKKGSMVKGDTIRLSEGMIFNVTATDRG